MIQVRISQISVQPLGSIRRAVYRYTTQQGQTGLFDRETLFYIKQRDSRLFMEVEVFENKKIEDFTEDPEKLKFISATAKTKILFAELKWHKTHAASQKIDKSKQEKRNLGGECYTPHQIVISSEDYRIVMVAMFIYSSNP